jgi:hypothetical protein
MSLFKNWKLILAASTVALFTACAGSSGGSEDYDNDDGTEEVRRSAPKEKVDENKLKKTEEEAVAITEENHKLRKEIFEAKNKLGISTAPASEE